MDIYYVNKTLYVEIYDVLKNKDKNYLKKRLEDIVKTYNVKNIVIENINRIYLNHLFIKEIQHNYEKKVSSIQTL